MLRGMEFLDVLRTRKSVRGFSPRPVPRDELARVLTAAQRAPSWCNIQPWRVFVTAGLVTEQLTRGYVAATQAGTIAPDFPWPKDYPEPYGTHRRECGKALYGAMGIARDDAAGRAAAWMRNYEAFGAPHVAVVALDKRFGMWAALDLGCWLQSLLLACVDAGLAACPQATLGMHAQVAREVLAIPDELGVLFGVAIGYEDPAVPANACHTTRAPLAEHVRFVGFPEGAQP
jgi:nitroreductase